MTIRFTCFVSVISPVAMILVMSLLLTAGTVAAQCSATLTANGPTTFCSRSPITLTASAGSAYNWYQNGFAWGYYEQTLQTSIPGRYHVVVTDGDGCSVATNVIELNVSFTYPQAYIETQYPGQSTTFCEGFSRTLIANPFNSSPTDTYLWSTGSTDKNITVSETGDYWVTVTNALGCSATSNIISISVIPKLDPPVITSTGPTTLCSGKSTFLLTEPVGYPVTIQWYRDGAPMSHYSYDYYATQPGEYSVLKTNTQTGCYVFSEPVTITVLPTPPASSVSPSGAIYGVCNSATITASVPPGTNFIWTHNEVDIPGTENMPTYQADQVGRFKVRTIFDNGCSTLSTNYLYVWEVTKLNGIAIQAQGPTTFCQGGSVTLASNAPASASTYWYHNGNLFSIDKTPLVTVGGTYSLRVSQNGCSAYATPITVTVNSLPSASITGTSTTTCTKPVTLTASAGTSYLWSTGATSRQITVNQPGDYTVRITNASGCSATSSPYRISRKEFDVSIHGKTAFCSGNHAELYASASVLSNYTYLWSDGKTTASNWPTASGSYWVSATDIHTGCSATSAPVNVESRASFGGYITASAPCFSQSPVTLTANPSGSSYSWSSKQTTRSITASTPDNYFVTVSVPTIVRGKVMYVIRTACFDLYPCFYPLKAAPELVSDHETDEQIEAYPNPADGELLIRLPTVATENFPVSLYDLTGKKIVSDRFDKGESGKVLSTNDIPNGIYVLYVQLPKTTALKRVIVSHEKSPNRKH